MVHSFTRNLVVTHYTWTTQPDLNVMRKVNNKGCFSHNPFPFVKSNETKTAFFVHHFSGLSVTILDEDRNRSAKRCQVTGYKPGSRNWHELKFSTK